MRTAKEAEAIWVAALTAKNVKATLLEAMRAMNKSHQEKTLPEKEVTRVESVECVPVETLEVNSVEVIEVTSAETIAVVAVATSKKEAVATLKEEAEATLKEEAEAIAGANHLASKNQKKNKMSTIRTKPIADTMTEDHSNVEIYL